MRTKESVIPLLCQKPSVSALRYVDTMVTFLYHAILLLWLYQNIWLCFPPYHVSYSWLPWRRSPVQVKCANTISRIVDFIFLANSTYLNKFPIPNVCQCERKFQSTNARSYTTYCMKQHKQPVIYYLWTTSPKT